MLWAFSVLFQWSFPTFILSGKIYLACMQVPNVAPLSQSFARHGHLLNKLIERRTAEVDGILNLSHPGRSVKFLKMTWKKLDCSASQVGGADNIFCELFGDEKAKNSFWLDSSSIEKVSLSSFQFQYHM